VRSLFVKYIHLYLYLANANCTEYYFLRDCIICCLTWVFKVMIIAIITTVYDFYFSLNPYLCICIILLCRTIIRTTLFLVSILFIYTYLQYVSCGYYFHLAPCYVLFFLRNQFGFISLATILLHMRRCFLYQTVKQMSLGHYQKCSFRNFV